MGFLQAAPEGLRLGTGRPRGRERSLWLGMRWADRRCVDRKVVEATDRSRRARSCAWRRDGAPPVHLVNPELSQTSGESQWYPPSGEANAQCLINHEEVGRWCSPSLCCLPSRSSWRCGYCGTAVAADAMRNLSGLLSATLALSSCRFSETFN